MNLQIYDIGGNGTITGSDGGNPNIEFSGGAAGNYTGDPSGTFTGTASGEAEPTTP